MNKIALIKNVSGVTFATINSAQTTKMIDGETVESAINSLGGGVTIEQVNTAIQTWVIENNVAILDETGSAQR